MKREAAVAGQFYPDRADILEKEISHCVNAVKSKKEVKGILSPHAGFIYSGKVAGTVFSQIEFPETFIILGPNHTGFGKAFALWNEGSWETPLGSLEVDENLARAILDCSSLIQVDSRAHIHEHSLEVQLPFIQHFSSSVKILPLTLGFGTFARLKEISASLVKAVKKLNRKTVIIASSDMTHYQPLEIAEKQDKMALEPLLKLEAERFYHTVMKNKISMCGYIPAAVMLLACKTLGAKEGKLVMYATSGEASGDFSQVVGYAGVIIE